MSSSGSSRIPNLRDLLRDRKRGDGVAPPLPIARIADRTYAAAPRAEETGFLEE
jgi:hypothetical protein